jgi:DNA polymerase-1
MRCAFGGDIEPARSTPNAISLIERAARELGATHLVVALDYTDAPSWRKVEFPDYKGHRTRDTSPWLIEGAAQMSARGWRVEMAAGFEADDVIATIALRSRGRAGVVVLSNDSDLLTLTAHPRSAITVARPIAGGAFQMMAGADVCAKYRIPAARLLPDFKAMVGESGDNVPGVPGIGPKKAAALLHKLGDLEAIILAGSGGYNRESSLVAEHADTARRAFRLVSLRTDVPIPPITPPSCSLRRATSGAAEP